MIYYEFTRKGIIFDMSKADDKQIKHLIAEYHNFALYGKLSIEPSYSIKPHIDNPSISQLAKFFEIIEPILENIFSINHLLNKSAVKIDKAIVNFDKTVFGMNGLFPSKSIKITFTPAITSKGWSLTVKGSIKPLLHNQDYPLKTFLNNFYSHTNCYSGDIDSYKLLQDVFYGDCGLAVGDFTDFEIELLKHYIDNQLDNLRKFVSENK